MLPFWGQTRLMFSKWWLKNANLLQVTIKWLNDRYLVEVTRGWSFRKDNWKLTIFFQVTVTRMTEYVLPCWGHKRLKFSKCNGWNTSRGCPPTRGTRRSPSSSVRGWQDRESNPDHWKWTSFKNGKLSKRTFWTFYLFPHIITGKVFF